MKIPKKISINGETIKVKFSDKECGEEHAYGLAKYAQNEIVLSKKYCGKKMAQDHINKTFLHEAVHFILDKGGHRNIANNEKLVNALSNGFMEVIKQI